MGRSVLVSSSTHNMKSTFLFLFVFLFGLSVAKPRIGEKHENRRIPRFGPTLNEVDVHALEPQLRILEKTEIERETRKIKEEIEIINQRLTKEEEDTLIQDCDDESDPVNQMDRMMGYDCECQLMKVKEVEFVEQVRCYNTTEEVCSMTQQTVFQAVTEKRCEKHFKKECWIDYNEQANSQTVRICTTKPQRKCDLTLEEKKQYKVENDVCEDHYDTVCETTYVEKDVIEDRPICENIAEEMCDDNGENCMSFTRKECKTESVTVKKVIPNTSCDQKKTQLCRTPLCPMIIENKVCRDIEKTFIAMVPKETCEIHPREVCTDIVKQYPSLKMVTKCQILPRETCSPERVQPKEVTKPVLKKVCSRIESDAEINQPEYGPEPVKPDSRAGARRNDRKASHF